MKILLVDAGNYCRSPVAECVLRKLQLAARLGQALSFGSAGLKDKHVGDSADPRSIAACVVRGYDLAAHRCREIATEDFREIAATSFTSFATSKSSRYNVILPDSIFERSSTSLMRPSRCLPAP